MDSRASDIWMQLSGWSIGEITAVIFAILYLVLAIRENIWCWFCAGVSTSIYIGVYFGAKLYMESFLNVFYLMMAIYGWFIWRSGSSGTSLLPVVKWPTRVHLGAVATIALCALISGYLLNTHTDAAFPYVDSATTFAAIWATFLVARKVLENWWYWLAIDAVSVVIYWARGLELTSILFVAYVVMIPFGIISWKNSWRRNQQSVT